MLKKVSPKAKRRDSIREIERFDNRIQTSQTQLDDASSTLNNVGSAPSTIRSDIMREPSLYTLECPCMVISCKKYACKIS
jgi:hypothetical protein